VRRVLLSSLRGAAVWAFRIDGVVHEHQTIQGVVEDVHQVIQNLKSLVVVLDEDVDEATLDHPGKAGPVTAAHIKARFRGAGPRPGHHLLTLQEDRELNMELHVNKGRGFVLADQHPVPRGSPVDLVRIDAIYNPVRRANFTVEETRVGQRTDFDRLTLHGRDRRLGLARGGRGLRRGAGSEAPGVPEVLRGVASPGWPPPGARRCPRRCRTSSPGPSRIWRS
jgi:DNA-directed RNA polymerase subunit alpha